MEMSFLKKFSLGKGFALFKKESRVLGVDLGSSSLKIVQLRKEKEKVILETYGEIATGPYSDMAAGKSVRLLETKVVEMLTDLMKEAKATAGNAIVSIPLRSSFVKVITMPLMSEAEFREAMPYEARKHVPVPVNEVIMDWWILPQGSSTEGQNSEGFSVERRFQEVLLVAIHREVVEKYQKIFRGAGINVKSFEIEIFSQVRSILSKELHPTLVIDFGAQATRFIIVDYGVVRMVHTFERGSLELTDVLSRSLSIDFERAERLKRDTGLSSRPEHKEIRNVIEPIMEDILSEGARVISEYRRRSERSCKKVWLVGGGSLLEGLIDFSITKFGVEVKLGDPFQKVSYLAFLEEVLKKIGPSFSGALGAALRSLEE